MINYSTCVNFTRWNRIIICFWTTISSVITKSENQVNSPVSTPFQSISNGGFPPNISWITIVPDGLSKQFAGLVSNATNIGSAGIILICSVTTHPSKLKTSKL